MSYRAGFVASLLLVASSTLAQPSGTVSGVVTDATGGVLPDTLVRIESESGLVSRQQKTGRRGRYSFLGLAVGSYRIGFERAGFKSAVSEGVRVEAGAAVTLDVTLELAGVEGAFEVRAPALDRKESGLSETVDRDLLQKVPNGRDVWVVLEETPGVVLDRFDVGGSESGQQSLFSGAGTSYTQNQYYVNGVNATDPAALGASSAYYSYDSFEEIQVSTSGHPAEIQSPGVFLNIVLKNGSNELGGGGALYFENDSLQSDNLDDALRARGVAQSNKLDRYLDFSLELGGPIVRDRAFFYANFGRQQIEPFVIGFFLPGGQPGIDETELSTLVARGTVELGSADNLGVLFFRNEKFRPFREAGRFRPSPETTFHQDSTTDILQVLYNRAFGGKALLEARFSRMDMLFPLGEQPDLPPDAFSRIELTNGLHSRGPGNDQLFERERFQAGAALFLFEDDLFGGSHDLKFGWQQSHNPARTTYDLTGSILYRDFFGAPFQVELTNDPVTSENRTRHLGVYAQDSVVLGRLVLNLGARLDRWTAGYPEQSRRAGPWEEVFSARGLPLGTGARSDVVSFGSFAPRLGFTYAVTGDGKTLVRGGYGRYYHQIGTGLSAFANPLGRAVALFAFSDENGNRLLDDGEVDLASPLSVNLPASNAVDAALEQPRTDEVTIGLERELLSELTVGATLIYRKDHRLIDDVNQGVPFDAFRETVAVDPGRDLALGTRDDTRLPVFDQSVESLGQDSFLLTNPDGLESRYRAIRIEARRRFTGGWQLLGSLTLNESEGFLPGPGFESAEGAGFPTPLFDNPNTLINARGRTFWDRPRILRVAGSYDLRWGIRVAGAFRSQTGQPIYRSVQVSRTASGTPLSQGPVEILAEPQGALVQPDVHLLDLRAERDFGFGKHGRLSLTLDVFNVFNANTAVEISSRRSTFGAVLKILPPRVARIGLRYRF